jgi:hypothetical protein
VLRCSGTVYTVFIGREGGGGGKKYQLKPLEFLLGTNNRQDDVIVLGMLTQVTKA